MSYARSALLLMLVAVHPSGAHAFQDVKIEQVIGGVDGNTAIQAIQLQMQSEGQENLAPMRLVVRDRFGNNPVVLFDFTGVVPNGGTGARVLIATANLPDFTNPELSPDFVLSNRIPNNYVVAGTLTYETDEGDVVYWRLSWGGANYQGPGTGSTFNDINGNFNPPFGGPLLASSRSALLFRFAAGVDSTNNANDYAASSEPAIFTNNAGQSGAIFIKTILGACCYGLNCSVMPPENCSALLGTFGGPGSGCDTAECAEPPANDECLHASILHEGITGFSNLGATTDGVAEPTCGFGFGDDHIGSDLWYVFSPNCNGEATISLCGSNYDTKIAVYDGLQCATSAPLVCNDDNELACGEDSLQSQVTFVLQAGHQYLIRVGGYVAAQGAGQINVQTSGCAPQPPALAPPECCHLEPALNGDWNGDCHVDLRDYAATQICRGRHGEAPSACFADGCMLLDVNQDGRIDLTDYGTQHANGTGPAASLDDCGDLATNCFGLAVEENPESTAGGTFFVFGNPPDPPPGYQPNQNPAIPAEFFDPGSLPFEGVIALGGQPIETLNLGTTDTIITHSPLRFGFGELPICDAVPAGVTQLNLRSREPIVVMRSIDSADCNGNAVQDSLEIAGGAADRNANGVLDECEWHVAMTLSGTPSLAGTLTACRTHENGGTFDAVLPISPRFVFVRKAALDQGGPASSQHVKVLEPAGGLAVRFVEKPFAVCPPDDGTYHTPCSVGNFVPLVETATTAGTEPFTGCMSDQQSGFALHLCLPTCIAAGCTYAGSGAPFNGCTEACGSPSCEEFSATILSGMPCDGGNAGCPHAGFFRVGDALCGEGCEPSSSTCVQLYGPFEQPITCTQASDELCP